MANVEINVSVSDTALKEIRKVIKDQKIENMFFIHIQCQSAE